MQNSKKRKEKRNIRILVYIAIFTITYFYPEWGWGNPLSGIVTVLLWIEHIWQGFVVGINLHNMTTEYAQLRKRARRCRRLNATTSLKRLPDELQELKDKFATNTTLITMYIITSKMVLITLLFLTGYTITAIALTMVYLLKFVISPLVLMYLNYTLVWVKKEREKTERRW
jgi:hypothetical protein